MDFDLQRGLHDLGADVRGTSLPVDLLVRRAHRRRVVRATTYSAVGTGAAAALVVGGVSLADGRPPAPAPAAPTPTSSPTPTADLAPETTPTPTSAPTAAFQPEWDLCGADLEALWDPGSTDPSVWGQAFGTGPEGIVMADPGGPVTAELEIAGMENQTEVLTAAVARTLVTAWDDETRRNVVVGVATAPVDLTAHGTITATDALALGTLQTSVAACGGAAGGDGTAQLDRGMYALVVETVLTREDGTTTTTLTTGNLAVGEPDELSVYDEEATSSPVTGEPSSLAPTPYRAASLGIPSCGAAWSNPEASSSWWTITGAPAVVDGVVEVEVTATGTGLDIPEGAALEPFVTVTRDGVVVAQTPDEAQTPFVVADWTTGSTVTRHVSLPAVTCAAVAGAQPGAPLPAGEYQVWAVQGVLRYLGGGAGTNLMYGGPWTLTVP